MKKTIIVLAVVIIAGLAILYQVKNRTPFDE